MSKKTLSPISKIFFTISYIPLDKNRYTVYNYLESESVSFETHFRNHPKGSDEDGKDERTGQKRNI